MRLPRVRFTVRRLMIVVVTAATIAFPIADLLRRSREFEQLSKGHRAKGGVVAISGVSPPMYESAKHGWHYRL